MNIYILNALSHWEEKNLKSEDYKDRPAARQSEATTSKKHLAKNQGTESESKKLSMEFNVNFATTSARAFASLGVHSSFQTLFKEMTLLQWRIKNPESHPVGLLKGTY